MASGDLTVFHEEAGCPRKQQGQQGQALPFYSVYPELFENKSLGVEEELFPLELGVAIPLAIVYLKD
jgi:hypothetical protein